MIVKRPVQVKIILTEGSKKEMEAEFKERLSQLKLELEQLRFQGKKIMHESSKKGADHLRQLQEKLHNEEKKRTKDIELTQFQIEQIQMLEIGTEILHSTVESEVEINVGDDWEALMKNCEIIIMDGIVQEIREGRGKHE